LTYKNARREEVDHCSLERRTKNKLAALRIGERATGARHRKERPKTPKQETERERDRSREK